jgi:hypothetical protein
VIEQGTLFVVQIQTPDGERFVMCEATNYTYGDLETAKAFGRDKWGQTPRVAQEIKEPTKNRKKGIQHA